MFPSDSAICLTDAVASFLQAKFNAAISETDSIITPSIHLSTQLVIDCEMAASVLASAVLNFRGQNSECMYGVTLSL
jgi:hypothetical protein